jgi:acetyltransferase-like isoleucine patch superfamily enzyme
LTTAFLALGQPLTSDVSNIRPVKIGNNCFIGRGSILMPGCQIGDNVIVGAGSVARGEIPDNAMVVGNPAQVIGDTLEWGRARLKLLEEGKLHQDPAWWGAVESRLERVS